MIDQEKCKNCLHKKRINAQNNWWFNACYHAPYKGKWIAEIEKCPKDQLKEKQNEH